LSRHPEGVAWTDKEEPIMAALDPNERNYHIIVALDFSELSNLALEQALALCTHHPHARLHAISVGRTKDEAIQLPGREDSTTHAADDLKDFVFNQVKRYKDEHGPFTLEKVVVYVAVGKPAARILSLAHTVHADVIVMGSHKREGVKRLLGSSVAEEVVREAECGVYIVHENTPRPPEHTLPPPYANIDVIFESEAQAI